MALVGIALGGCRARTPAGGAAVQPAEDAATFTRAVAGYLERRGDLCLSRPVWPIDVPEGAAEGPDAVQLPELERLGVVTSTLVDERQGGVATPFRVRRYRLTAEGRKHYLDRDTRQPAALEDGRASAHADFCVVAVELGKVTRWDVQRGGASRTALVSYTYGVDAPAWTRDARFQRVFPAVARLIVGAGSAELVEGFTLTPAGWTPNELLPPLGGASAPQAAAP
jgi:hypothetical protein